MKNDNSGLFQRFKRLMPNSIKQHGKDFLYDLLKIPYSKFGVSLAILRWLPKSKPITFFDIGAKVGHFSLSLAGEYKIEQGFLVEPVLKIIPVIEKNFPDRTKFKIFNAAIADLAGETEFFVNEDADHVSSLLKIFNKNEELSSLNIAEPVSTKIKTLTLDHIVKEQKLSHIDLIKIDVQGAEHLVLQGGIETLKITRLVYTEFSYKPLYENSSTFFDLYKIFYENNFILVHTSNGYSSANGELLQGDALFANKALMNGRL
jgi:FkbM family methyltransferase